ncbi:MAG: hypothetical protein ACT4R6_06315 [Gemmatimonadaceae bacterium]
MVARLATAQGSTPVAVLLEPGLLTASAVSAAEGASTLTGFHIRIAAVFRTDSARIRPMLGIGVTPFGFRGSGVRSANAPSLFAGAQLVVLPPAHTAGWLTAYVPILFLYSYRGGATDNTRLYGADLAAEAAVVLHVGRKLFGDLGTWWLTLGAFAYMQQNLTPNVEVSSGKRDRFRPDFVYGVSIPLTGRR